jgi:hypothetical protein
MTWTKLRHLRVSLSAVSPSPDCVSITRRLSFSSTATSDGTDDSPDPESINQQHSDSSMQAPSSSTPNPHPHSFATNSPSPPLVTTVAPQFTGLPTVVPPSGIPYLTATRTPPPVVAYAVPLSLVGAILLVATVLSLRGHRRLKQQRASDAEKIDLSRGTSFSSYSSDPTRLSDVKHALDMLSGKGTFNDFAPTPTFLPASSWREPRQQTRQAFPVARHVMAPSEMPLNSICTNLPRATSRCLTNVSSTSTPNLNFGNCNVSVTNLMLSEYLSPPPMLSPPLSSPQRLYVRSEAASPSPFTAESYIHRDKPLPFTPRLSPIGTGDNGVYDAVAHAIGHH